jgi:hypothetical protein
MVNVDLAKVSKLPNTAEVLSWIAIALAIIGCGLSILTDFLPHEIASHTLTISLVSFLLAFIPWSFTGYKLVDVFHDTLITSFKVDLGALGNIDAQTLSAIRQFLLGPTPERLITAFVKYFEIHALTFYTPIFIGILNIVFYGSTRASEIHATAILPSQSLSVPLQPFVSTLIVAIPITVSIILGIGERRSSSISSDPGCIIQLWPIIKSRRTWLFIVFIDVLIFLALSFFFMPVTLTPKTDVLSILWASSILGMNLGLLASIIHYLISEITKSDIMYLYCLSIDLLKKKLAGQKE